MNWIHAVHDFFTSNLITIFVLGILATLVGAKINVNNKWVKRSILFSSIFIIVLGLLNLVIPNDSTPISNQNSISTAQIPPENNIGNGQKSPSSTERESSNTINTEHIYKTKATVKLNQTYQDEYSKVSIALTDIYSSGYIEVNVGYPEQSSSDSKMCTPGETFSFMYKDRSYKLLILSLDTEKKSIEIQVSQDE